MSAPCCHNCRFFRIVADESTLEDPHFGCRRYPPAAHPDPDRHVYWPPVVSADWCGEHQPAEIDVGRQIAEHRRAHLEGIRQFVEVQLRHEPPGSACHAEQAERLAELEQELAALEGCAARDRSGRRARFPPLKRKVRSCE